MMAGVGGGGRARYASGAAALLAVLVLLLLPRQAPAAPGDNLLVDRANGLSGTVANGSQSGMAISANGRYIAFVSVATNLSPDDTDTVRDIYRRDLVTGTTVLVSRADGAAGVKSDSESFAPAISADGRYVAWHTSADNLDPGDLDANGDVYVRDVQSAETELVSVSSSEENANASAANASISADGSRIAFSSAANNLHPDDTGNTSVSEVDIFVRDRAAGTTILVSRATGAAGAQGNERSGNPDISADGTRVAFSSIAGNFDIGDTDSLSSAYVRDLASDTTTLASRADGVGGASADRALSSGRSVRISADGEAVAFVTTATNLDSAATNEELARVFVRRLVDDQTDLVSRADGSGSPPASRTVETISAPVDSGIAFVSAGPGWTDDSPPGAADFRIYVRDSDAGTTKLISRADGPNGGPVLGSPSAAELSADGSFLAFTSSAPDVVPGVADGLFHLYRRELVSAGACEAAEARLTKAEKKVRKAKRKLKKAKKRLKVTKKKDAPASHVKRSKKRVKKARAKLKRTKGNAKAARAEVSELC